MGGIEAVQKISINETIADLGKNWSIYKSRAFRLISMNLYCKFFRKPSDGCDWCRVREDLIFKLVHGMQLAVLPNCINTFKKRR